MSARLGDTTPAGLRVSTVLADFDFETYSEAGYTFNEELNKWESIVASPPHGIGAVGASVYSEHPSTEVLCLAYDLKDGTGPRIWLPGNPPPEDLFAYLAEGGLIEACNSGFEYYIWSNVCVKRMGWPVLEYTQLRCVASKARAYSIPGGLGDMTKVLECPTQKEKDGKRLIRKFCCPHKPTKKNPQRRLLLEHETVEQAKMYAYCLGDIASEASASQRLPDLTPRELELWLLDQEINFRGVHIDRAGLDRCMAAVREYMDALTGELVEITEGFVDSVSKLKRMKTWLAELGVEVSGLTSDDVEGYLANLEMPDNARRVLEIRQLIGSASIKKLSAIDRRLSADGRLRDLFVFCGADRTSRFAGRGPQPQNLPNSGPDVAKCACGKHYVSGLETCPWCGLGAGAASGASWSAEAVGDCLGVMNSRDLARHFGDPITAIAGCLRGLFVARPGYDLICSDYSAIEAVVLAFISGEQWRMDVFNTHGKIYEMSASKISGVPFEELMQHKADTGEHHPLRKKIGKVAELACFGANTLVLTDQGYVAIADVNEHYKLWDGHQWVTSDGSIDKGVRETLNLDGVIVTPDHPIGFPEGWAQAKDVSNYESALERALEFGGRNVPNVLQRATLRQHTSKNVYDIVNAGPRNCFTIKTDSGHLIVHNSGYQGGYGAWLAFGADKHLSEPEIRDAIKAWRNESPAIVAFWHGLEQAAKSAIGNPGTCYEFRGISYGMRDKTLHCRLLNGRTLTYHNAELRNKMMPWGKIIPQITYMGWNTDYKKGPKGWMRLDTYGGKLCENVVQATARDILTHAMVNLNNAGYPIVLHVHDEIVSEIPKGTGSIEAFEEIMATMPDWCSDWPVKAAGGWRGLRYRKG